MNTTTQSTDTIDPSETAATTELATLPSETEAMAEPEGMSTGAKVAMTATGGLLAYGLYRLGEHLGWWGGSGIIMDDTKPPPKDSGGGSGGGSTSPRKRATGKPPNITGNPSGYNTELWRGPGPIRLALITQGYSVRANEQPLSPDDTPHAQITQLQTDWNKVIRGIDSGKVKLPKDASESKLLKHYRGLLVIDGIVGKNSLNALEVILENYTKNAIFWKKLKEQSRS